MIELSPDERWIREATFLARLDPGEQDRVLRLARREQHAARTPLLNGRSLALVLRGEVEVEDPLRVNPRRGTAGRVFGAGAVTRDRDPRVVAITPVELLRIDIDELLGLQDAWQIRDLLGSLADLEHQLDVFDELLRQEPSLRALPAAWREQLLQCGHVRDCLPGEVLLEAGKRNKSLIIMLRGTARLSHSVASARAVPNSRLGQLIPAGTLLGAQSFEDEQPPVQPYLIEAATSGRVLILPWVAVAHLHVRLRATTAAAVPVPQDGKRGRAHLIHTTVTNLGATALSLGTAIALDERGSSVAVLDLDGERTALRLRAQISEGWYGGVRARSADLPGDLPTIYWPVDRGGAADLCTELQRQHEHVLVTVSRTSVPDQPLLDRILTVVHLYEQGDTQISVTLAQHQRLIHALRQPAGGIAAERTVPGRRPQGPDSHEALEQSVRVPFDKSVEEVYAGSRIVRQLGMDETPFGRACNRLARMLTGKAVGLALGGGGAWGFAHLGLLRALHESEIPIDYVSGTSFGAVVGAAWVAAGPAGLDRLERYSRALMPMALGCTVSTVPIGLLIDQLFGPTHQLSTEIPLLAVASDVRTASSFVLPAGTLADAVRASSGFPGIFSSFEYAGRRLVDGGVSANVPAEVVHTAGADFILASNVIPRMIEEGSSVSELPGLRRVSDLVRSMLTLMHRSSARDAALADHIFNARVGRSAPHEFWLGPQIAEAAYEQALGELPAIRAAYEADLSTHLLE
ncbi:patatin-like phospholipase family protein [Myxococcota bacterium]|nr:patatin-like phospholipase family protein [Myxococcota bacterium]